MASYLLCVGYCCIDESPTRSILAYSTVLIYALLPQKNRCTSPRAFFAYEVETFAGGVELLRHWGRRPKARVGVAAPPASSASAPAAIIARSSSSSQVPCTPLLPTLLLPIDGRGAQHLELMLRDGERDDRVAPVDLLALR